MIGLRLFIRFQGLEKLVHSKRINLCDSQILIYMTHLFHSDDDIYLLILNFNSTNSLLMKMEQISQIEDVGKKLVSPRINLITAFSADGLEEAAEILAN